MKNIFAIFVIIVLILFCGSIFLGYAVKKTMIDKGEKNVLTNIVYSHIQEDETRRRKSAEVFVNAVEEKLQHRAVQHFFESKDYAPKKENAFFQIKEMIDIYAKRTAFRTPIVKSGIITEFHSGNKILPNGAIDLGDGFITTPLGKNSLKNINEFVKKVENFKYILDSLGIPLVYAQYPNKICNEDNVSKYGRDFSNRAKRELMEKLSKAGVHVIDFHREFHIMANDYTKEFHHSLFYKTDNHWTARTTIHAGRILGEKLNEIFDFNLNVGLLDANNFTERLAPRKWLGSIGEKVIPLYEKENFYTYSPEFTTDINWVLYENIFFESSGNFDNLHELFNSNAREDKGVLGVAYPSFSFSQNNNLQDGKTILLIGDSFNIPFSKFLSLIFKEVYFINRRSSLLDDYLANGPDVVVLGFDNTPFSEELETLLF